jgi:GNAT superfamily N-acetyltransferase
MADSAQARPRPAGEPRIRRATPEDAPELAQLRYAFRAELDPPIERQAEFVERCTAWMAERLRSGGPWFCWVALLDDTMVGTIWLQQVEKLPNPAGHLGFHGYVSSVYVAPQLRNSGLGSALLQTCLAEADSRGLDAVFLWPSARSRPLYERHGFAVRDDLLERRR